MFSYVMILSVVVELFFLACSYCVFSLVLDLVRDLGLDLCPENH